MEESKNAILEKIRSSIMQREAPQRGKSKPQSRATDYFASFSGNPLLLFEERFVSLGGIFHAVSGEEEVQRTFREIAKDYNIQEIRCEEEDLRRKVAPLGIHTLTAEDKKREDIEVSLTSCESLVARTGTIVVSPQVCGSRSSYALAATHIVFSKASQLVEEAEEAWDYLQKKYQGHFPSAFSWISSPSRTADIEKTLVLGVHGPKRLILIIDISQ